MLAFVEMDLDNTTMFTPGTNVMFTSPKGEPILAQVVGYSGSYSSIDSTNDDSSGGGFPEICLHLPSLLPKGPSHHPKPSTRKWLACVSVHAQVEQDQRILHRAGQGVGLSTPPPLYKGTRERARERGREKQREREREREREGRAQWERNREVQQERKRRGEQERMEGRE